jgi:hypothetical protein
MTIPVVCECGHVSQAPDGSVGRRLKCKGCGAILAVPEPSPIPTPSPHPSRKDLPRADASITMYCACGQKLDLKGKDAGKKGECRNCGRAVKIPAAGTHQDDPFTPFERQMVDRLDHMQHALIALNWRLAFFIILFIVSMIMSCNTGMMIRR